MMLTQIMSTGLPYSYTTV